MEWTDEDTDKAIKMWQEGNTSAKIAKALGRSKNSIIGRLNRLGHGRPKVRKVKKEDFIPSDFILTLADAQPHHCRFIDVVPHICGKDIYKRSMCEEHYARCFIPPKSRKEVQKDLDEHRAKTQDWKNRAV